MKSSKRILSLMIAAMMCILMLPDVAFAATATTEHVGDWLVTKEPTHSTFTVTDSSMRIDQTKQTRYQSDGTTNNGNFDGKYTLFVNGAGDLDENRSYIGYQGLRGDVTITFTYKMNNINEDSNGNPFYRLDIPGYLNLRIYNDGITVLNSGASAGNKITNKNLTNVNSVGAENTVVITIDTVEDDVTVNLNNGSTTAYGDSYCINVNNKSQGYVGRFTLESMERMSVGSYFEVTSFKVTGEDASTYEFDDETKNILASFPDSLVEDPYNVTSNVTLPWEYSGIEWVSSDHSVMNEFGKIQRLSASDPKEVEISCTFNGKTTDGKTIPIQRGYMLTVTGLNNSLDVTATVNPGSDPDAEKWYTMPERGEIEDGYPILDDPMYISDEAFFGKWDSSTGTWTLKPYFRYESYPDMASVEAYAKAGNYENAKAELQNYYRRHFDEKTDKQTSLSVANQSYHRIMYEYLSRNAYPTSYISSFPINIFNIPKSKGEVKIDVTNRINEAIGSFTCFSTMIASIDKYKNQAKIYSKESSTPPVLVITLEDGTVYECPVEKDSYIQAGSYADANYGDATVLLAEEAGTWNNYEDRTKRAYIGFDISGFKKGAKAKDAYIKLTAEHTGSDAEKTMILYWYCDSSWQEDSVCFNTFTDYMYFSCNDMNAWDYITSNKTNIKGKVCGYHRGGEVGSLADLYSFMDYIGPDDERYDADYEKYAYTYIRQHMALLNAIGVEPDVMNSLDFSGHITTVAQDTLRLIDSDYMTPNRFTAFLKHLWLASEYKIYNGYGTHYNNWATYSTGAVYAVCARYPEFARHDIWLEATREENDRVTNAFVFEDGMSLELSQGYTNTILSTFNSPYALMELTGAESPYNENTENVIYNLVMSLFNQTAPGGGSFGLGDSTNPYAKQTSLYSRWYNYLFEGDPIIAYMAKNGSVGWLPENSTTNYPVGQRTFMRSDWTDDAVAMSITNKMDGSHGHKDALSVAMYAYGKFLLVDPGYGAILTGNIRNYMISPQQHNMVTVNDYTNYLDPETNAISSDISTAVNTLAAVDGEQLNFDSNKHYDFVEYSTPAFTTTELSQRSVTFLKDAKVFVVTDYIIPNDTTAENVYTQNWHLYPGSDMTFDSNKVIRSNFEDEPNVMLVPVAPDEIDEVTKVKTLFSEDSGQFIDNEKAVLKKTKTGKTTFSTIILPMDVGEDFEVTTAKLSNDLDENEVNMFSFTVKDKNTSESGKFYYYHVNDESLQTIVKVGNYTTDAQTLIVEEFDTGYIKSMYMVNGTFVAKNGSDSMRTTEKTSASFTIKDKVLDYSVYNSDATALNNVTFNAALANTVTYDGEEYEFTVTDGKITFSDVVAPEEPNVDPNAGTVIYDSAENPELLQLYTIDHEYYKVTNMGKDGIKFENAVSVPYKDGAANSDSRTVGRIRLSGIVDSDEENGTKTVSNLMAGKYAVEITMQQNIDTERVENGSKKNTYASFAFGTSNNALTSGLNSFMSFRLYTEHLNIIRTAETQKDNIRLDVNTVGLQTFKPDEEWKLRVVFDTVNKTYTVFVDGVTDPKAIEFPYNVVSKNTNGVVTWTEKPGNFLPDFQLTLMDASTVGSYVWVKNVKIYEIEPQEDERFNVINSLPLKLYAGNPSLVDGSLNVPALSGVTWSSSNPSLIGTDGKLTTKVTQPTPITFTATGSVADTEVTSRTFTFKRTYDMTVVSNSWTLNATKSGKTVKASVSSMTENYGLQPALIIAGYNNDGAVCDMHIKPVTEKLENYEYTLNSETATIKVFLLDTLSNSVPLAQHILFE